MLNQLRASPCVRASCCTTGRRPARLQSAGGGKGQGMQRTTYMQPVWCMRPGPALTRLPSPSLCWLSFRQTGRQGAMKVVKSAAHYTEAARDEITLLSQIAEKDPGQLVARRVR